MIENKDEEKFPEKTVLKIPLTTCLIIKLG